MFMLVFACTSKYFPSPMSLPCYPLSAEQGLIGIEIHHNKNDESRLRHKPGMRLIGKFK
jgi:hypothetical protein